MDGGSLPLAGRGVTGRLSVIAVACAAVVVVAFLVAWPSGGDDAAPTTTTTRPDATPAAGARRTEPIRGWTVANGQALLSNDDACSLVSVAELAATTRTPLFEDPLRLAGKRSWGGQCWYFSDKAGDHRTVSIEYGTDVTDDIAAATADRGSVAVSDAEACDELFSSGDNTSCLRLVRLADVGDQAAATMAFVLPEPDENGVSGPGTWVIDELRFDHEGLRMRVALDRSLADQRARTIALARLIDARLPSGPDSVQLIARPAECPESGSC